MTLTEEEIKTLTNVVSLSVLNSIKFISDKPTFEAKQLGDKYAVGLSYISTPFRLALYENIGHYLYRLNPDLVKSILKDAAEIVKNDIAAALNRVTTEV